jgi:hypothetical protein
VSACQRGNPERCRVPPRPWPASRDGCRSHVEPPRGSLRRSQEDGRHAERRGTRRRRHRPWRTPGPRRRDPRAGAVRRAAGQPRDARRDRDERGAGRGAAVENLRRGARLPHRRAVGRQGAGAVLDAVRLRLRADAGACRARRRGLRRDLPAPPAGAGRGRLGAPVPRVPRRHPAPVRGDGSAAAAGARLAGCAPAGRGPAAVAARVAVAVCRARRQRAT